MIAYIKNKINKSTFLTERLSAPTAVLSASFGIAALCPCPTHLTLSAIVGIPLAIISFFIPEIKNKIQFCSKDCDCTTHKH